jgi:hypothetical protein
MYGSEKSYSDIIGIMQEQAKGIISGVEIGTVVNNPPNLVIKIGELQLDKDNILVAKSMIQHKRNSTMLTTVQSGITDSQSVGDHGSHSHTITQIGFSQGVIESENCLWEGDLVAVLATEDKQTYIVLCKVVKPDG